MEMFQHEFMIYALIIGLSLAIAGAFLSPFLVLNNQAMIADGLSHIAFTGVIIGYLFSEQPLYIAIPFVAVASILITYLSDKVKINNDAAISVVASFSLAVGLIIVTVNSGFNRSIDSLLIGSILTVTRNEVILSIILVLIVIAFIIFNFRNLLTTIYDGEFASSLGKNSNVLKYLLNVITSLFVIIGTRTVGTLLISALTVFPTLISLQLSKSFSQTLVFNIISSILATLIGIIASYHLGYPTGSTIVVMYMILLILGFITKKIRGGLYANDKT